MNTTSIGLVGCGAVIKLFHVPPLLARDDCRISVLVDNSLKQFEAIRKRVPAARTATSISGALEFIDAGIVAVPHFMHAAASCELLSAGKHVLVEKPMALTASECDQMLAAAKAGGATITVGHMRRFCPAVAFAHQLIHSNILGAIRSVDVEDGAVFGWPVESDFQFRKEKAGGGVLVDTGAHTLDMLIAWFGEAQPVSYRDDACGGVEADCVAELRLAGGAPCLVELSRTRNLRNSAIIEGEKGRMEVFFYQNKVVLKLGGELCCVPFDCTPQTVALTNPSPWRHMFDYQLDDWLKSIREGRPGKVSGEEGATVVRLIEKLQAMREPWIHSWDSNAMEAAL